MNAVWRVARPEDIPAVIKLLSDDVLGRGREQDEPERYLEAFDAMQDEGSNTLYVGECDGRVVATYQLTIISGLSLKATRRAQLESLRVASDQRGSGIGAALMQDAEARARAAGCGLMQLTSNASRDQAHAFYERAGYAASHVGFKRSLD